MLKEQISMYLPQTHNIIVIWNNRIQNGRRIAEKLDCYIEGWIIHLISRRPISVQWQPWSGPVDLLDSFDE